MALAPLDVVLRNRFGPVVPGGELYVYERGTETEVTVYSDEAGTTPRTQPLEADRDGTFPDHWIAPGLYDRVLVGDEENPRQPFVVPIAFPDGEQLTVEGGLLALDGEEYATKTYADLLAQDIDGRYRIFKQSYARAVAATVNAGATYAVADAAGVTTQANATNPTSIYIDPDDHALSGSTTKLRLVAACAINDTAPAVTLTLGLYPFGTPSGAATIMNPNYGARVTGTDIAFASPAANSKSAQTYTSEINLPSEGWYGIGLLASGAMAAASVAVITWRLEIRNV